MKNNTKRIKNILSIIFFLIIIGSICFFSYNGNIKQLIGKIKANINASMLETKAEYEIVSQEDDNVNICMILENEKGIDEIILPDMTIYGKGKKKIAIDRVLNKEEVLQLKVKIIGDSDTILYKVSPITTSQIIINNQAVNAEGLTKSVEIEYPEYENLKKYYSLNDGESWQEYVGPFEVEITDYDTIVAKTETLIEGKEMTCINPPISYGLIFGESLLTATEKSVRSSRYYKIVINDEEYRVHSYVLNEDTTIESDTIYGDKNDIGTASSYAQHMVILKVNGDLIIDEEAILTAYGAAYGGPKGMLVYTTGTLTNNGTISMSGKGAYAVGQNVYLWKNEGSINGEYEYVPAVGANGAASVSGKAHGKKGINGINRETAGGGSGASIDGATSGRGGNGTSYSGGTGGGAARNSVGYAGSDYGGKGGNAGRSSTASSGSGGGAGNPGGINSVGQWVAYPGANGTGGLLIIYGNSIENNGLINSNGLAGGNGRAVGGGASGGGSINLFYKNNIVKGTIYANGGAGGRGNSYTGGSGGDGSILVGSIATGTYEEY